MTSRTNGTPQGFKTDLVINPAWNIDNVSGCCGASLIYRLNAHYCTKAMSERRADNLIAEGFRVFQPRDATTTEHFERDLQHICIDAAFAVSLDTAFAAVVQDMLEQPTDLFLATDNVSRNMVGDVHRGPFSTRGFMAWLAKNELAHVRQGVRVRHITTWSAKLRIRSAERYKQRTIKQFYVDYAARTNGWPVDSGSDYRW